MSNVQIDAKVFHRRARYLLTQWKTAASKTGNDEFFQNADTILIAVGNADEDNPYQKSTAVQTWLLGYEFPQTLMLFTQEKLHIMTSPNKAGHLEGLQLSDNAFPIEIYKRTKDDNENKKAYEQLVDLILQGKRIGTLPKDKFAGKIIDEWKKALESADKKIEEVDVSAGIASVLAIKDDEEVKTTRAAARVSSLVMKNYFIDEMSAIIDEEKSVSHEKLAELTEGSMFDEKLQRRMRIPSDVSNIDLACQWICWTGVTPQSFKAVAPTISGLLPSQPRTVSTREQYFVHLASDTNLIARILAEPFLLIPTRLTQEKNYEFLVELQHRVLSAIKDGVKIKDVYQKGLGHIKARRPELEKHFVKNIGFGMGIEFRESNYTLTAKNNKELRNGMILNLSIGFQDIENPKPADDKSKTYSLLLIDTVRVTNDAPSVLTDCNKNPNDISYFFKEEEGEEDPKKSDKPAAKAIKSPEKKTPPKNTAVLKTKFRSEQQDEDSTEHKRKMHQKELAAQKQAEGLARFGDGADKEKDEKKAVFRKFESYKSDAKLPKEVKNLRNVGFSSRQITVDQKAESIICPIYGLAVPFHISTLKNASKSDEGEFVILRLNFLTPGQAGSKKEDMPFDDINATFVRALTYRSSDVSRMAEVYKNIMDLKKNAAKRSTDLSIVEAERKEMADIVEQEKLAEVKGRRAIRLGDVFARPALEGKRVPGELEIHMNGLRYQSPMRSDHRIDILFANIRHLFFQPCDNELIVLLHFHLKNPVILGKKKTKDIQFYREASDAQFDETGNRKRRYHYGDEDELESEQEERRRRAALNKEFKTFAEKLAEASDGRFDVDIPFRELGFQGVPFRSNVLLQPTTECLVHLTDPPFLVITLGDIEIAHLERVQFGLKNFDLVFIFKDYTRAPIHINTIPMSQLDNVKDWLDSVDIAVTEGPMNLNWTMIMKTVNEDTGQFFQDGGWGFLGEGSDGEGEDDASESASEFELDDDETEESSSGDSSQNDDASADEGSEESEEESGEDWDELEEKARRADEKRDSGVKRKEDSDDDRTTKKKSRR
ncbi:hypothetical protein BC938DRAFT_479592 [Jimgerdemannia flammicorona]|uniref:FACT complex subunit n=1 Tax=Jimgerdemannia flammicorona TaxID=994334 RepID=A0A433QKH9_9FUNG|nr:hypothetical protein BC938DRAFT_479592 [Jimgerdemannia flammicorona]